MGLAVFFGGAVLSTQGYSLAYRLAVVTSRSTRDRFVSAPHVVAMVLGYLLLILSAVCAILYTLDSKEVREAIFAPVLTCRHPLQQLKMDLNWMKGVEYVDAEDTAVFCFDLLPEHFQQTATRLVYIVGAVVFAQTLCVTLVVLIFRRLHANASMFSEKTKRMHRQLTLLLLIQVILGRGKAGENGIQV